MRASETTEDACAEASPPSDKDQVMVFKPHEIKPFLALALSLQREGGLCKQQALRCAMLAWRALRERE